MTASKIVAAAASGVGGGAGLDVDEVFSTFLYEGNGSTQTITNGIDLSGEGGLVWIKNRDDAENHGLVDTAVNGLLFSNLTNAANTGITHTFNTNGFTVGSSGSMNDSNDSHVSWTFRKAPKFFDVVVANSISGSGNTISHSLGCDVGMIIAKKTDGVDNWYVWHRGINTGSMYLNGTNATGSITTEYVFGNGSSVVQPTSTQFTFGAPTSGNYVFYLFAHNNSDGGFGPDGDADIIKCGSVTTNGSGVASANLGFETQWLMYKKSSGSGSWVMYDNMRGLATTGSNIGAILYADGNYATLSTSAGDAKATATGIDFSTGENNTTYIYMAIRRGSLFPPDDATKVFGVSYTYTYDVNGNTGGSSAQLVGYIGKPADLNIQGYINGSSFNGALYDRLRGSKYLLTNTTSAEVSVSGNRWDNMAGFREVASAQDTTMVSWTWKRAPSFFDVITTTTSNADINHSLGVVPELTIYRNRSGDNWAVFAPTDGALFLNSSQRSGGYGNGSYLNQTYGARAAATTVSDGGGYLGNNVNVIIYLFASLSGISKIGSYTGSSSGVVTVDCGFSNGARFVLIKRNDAVGDWYVYDSVRGINSSADDPYLLLNTTDAEATNTNNIEPHSSGFQLTQQGANPISINGGTYLFYAIA